MKPTTSVNELKGVGEAVAKKLHKLGIATVEDMLLHYPRRYEDYSVISPIGELTPGQVSVRGSITRLQVRRSKRGTTITEAIIEDDSGEVKAVWFNQPYLKQQLARGVEVYLSGELAFKYQQFALQSPTVEKVSTFQKDTARIVPVYPETAGLTSKMIRRLMLQALKAVKLSDPLPASVREDYGLMSRQDAVAEIHFPTSTKALEAARERIAFEELFMLMLVMRSSKEEIQAAEAPVLTFDKETAKRFTASLPFDLTDDQRKASWHIIQDLEKNQPMNRLLQGDVGSGKTVVAALAALMCIRSGWQVAFLAPTEILATQHLETLQEFLGDFEVPVAFLSAGTKARERSRIVERIAAGEPLLVVGTHALFSDDVSFSKLGLLIIDEQHRFGVKQRQALQQSNSLIPHTLSMSATPIPRSLALTVYGDLDISSLRSMPPGRIPVTTEVGTNTRALYSRVYELIQEGRQVFVVCPLIEDSDTLGVSSVNSKLTELKRYWPKTVIAGMHGRLKRDEKAAVMSGFASGDIQVLVSTTVVEVGVDVAGASVMLVEDAERFGLATLHQLRGRVGRGGGEAYCFLKTSSTHMASHRLSLLERYHDGFTLAEEDLRLRGAGQLYGHRQHGELDLRLASLADTELIDKAKRAVMSIEKIEDHPLLISSLGQAYSQVHSN